MTSLWNKPKSSSPCRKPHCSWLLGWLTLRCPVSFQWARFVSIERKRGSWWVWSRNEGCFGRQGRTEHFQTLLCFAEVVHPLQSRRRRRKLKWMGRRRRFKLKNSCNFSFGKKDNKTKKRTSVWSSNWQERLQWEDYPTLRTIASGFNIFRSWNPKITFIFSYFTVTLQFSFVYVWAISWAAVQNPETAGNLGQHWSSSNHSSSHHLIRQIFKISQPTERHTVTYLTERLPRVWCYPNDSPIHQGSKHMKKLLSQLRHTPPR